MFALLALGYSINLLTLLALVLAIGLVVDDAIVVVENIHRHIEEGMAPFDAALTGAREIAVPVISMTITLAAVYAPIGFVSGLTGALFREFAFTLAGAVVVSGVVALTLSPMMASKLLRSRALDAGGSTQLPRPHLRPPAPALRAPSPPHAQRPAGDAPDPRGRRGRDRHHVHDDAEGAGARGGPGHPVQYRQERRKPPTSTTARAGDQRAQQGVRDRPRARARLHHQRLGQQRAPGHRRHPVQALGGAHALAEGDSAEPAAEGGRRRRRAGHLLCPAVAAGLDRRPAGPVRDHDHGRLYPAGAGAGRGAGGGSRRAASSSSPTATSSSRRRRSS